MEEGPALDEDGVPFERVLLCRLRARSRKHPFFGGQEESFDHLLSAIRLTVDRLPVFGEASEGVARHEAADLIALGNTGVGIELPMHPKINPAACISSSAARRLPKCRVIFCRGSSEPTGLLMPLYSSDMKSNSVASGKKFRKTSKSAPPNVA